MGLIQFVKRKAKHLMCQAAKSVLKDQEVQTRLWEIVNRPKTLGKMEAQDNIWLKTWELAGSQTAHYIMKNMLKVQKFPDSFPLFDFALSRVSLKGLYLEFGAGWRAESINYLADHIEGLIHGFDSFKGLPEEWFGQYKTGSLTTDGVLPSVKQNVKLHVGLFADTLPQFKDMYREDVAFMHIDCDLYSSTKTVFDTLNDRIRPGTVIQFDEYLNYPGWRHHEFKAFHEFIEDSGLGYEYLGFVESGFSVAVQIK